MCGNIFRMLHETASVNIRCLGSKCCNSLIKGVCALVYSINVMYNWLVEEERRGQPHE